VAALLAPMAGSRGSELTPLITGLAGLARR